jgi:pyruvate dehydrogenase E2 component (dihydrolipoamide acetyltransferase)
VARVDVVMPQMGESIAEGTLSRWLKKVGDAVKRDEPIFEISTDKVDAEIPAPSSGVLAEILVTEGQTVPVSTVVARLETEVGAAVPAAAPAPKAEPAKAEPVKAAPAKAAASAPSAPAKTEHAPRTAATGNGASLEERLRTKSSPLVRKIAAEHGVEIAGMQGSGIAGRVTKRDIMQFLEGGGTTAARPSMHAPAGVDYHAPMV